MKGQHTRGPWRAALDPEWQHRQDEHHVEVACIPHGCWDAIDVFGPKAAHHDCDSPAQHIANARLIAAAPEMLDALKDALNYLENTEGEFGITLNCADAARAAIAKATAVERDLTEVGK
jgi:hypothetical protein